MQIRTQKTIFRKLSYLLIIICALFCTLQCYADDNVSPDDIDAAYDYYSSDNVNTPSVPLNPASPNKNPRPGKVGSAGGIGGIASNLMQPVEVVAGFLVSMAIIIGMTCLFAAFVRYMQHRVNPLAHPISTVVTLFILGILLLCLPLIYKFTENGVPFSLG